MPDQTIACVDCSTPFLYTEKDQSFYLAQNYTPPKRCKACRAAKKARQNNG